MEKTRPGSLLRRDDPIAEPPDLRGEFEHRRDYEVVRHYTRVAELDVIEEVAHAHSDEGLMERVEAVRRKELRRFWMSMQRLRDVARQGAAQRPQ